MSLPHYKITILALSLGVASAFVGCSSNPSKKDVVDKGPQSSEQVYFEKAQKSLERNQYTDAVKSLEALDNIHSRHSLNFFMPNSNKKIMRARLHWRNVSFV